MHGRLLTIPATLLMMAFAATPAPADQTLGLGQPADADGVVVGWQLTSGTAQSGIRLRSTQALGGGTATTATSDAVSTAPGQVIAARLPIAADGRLELVGATGSPAIQATVEPDADGDGYGDTTQDACLRDFSDHTAPCGGTLTVGSPLTLAPDPRGFGNGNPMQALQGTAAGTTSAAAAPGILTRWRVRSATAGGDIVLQLLRPVAGGAAFRVIAESAAVDVTSTDVLTVPAQLAVQAGDRLAARSVTGDLGAVAHRTGDSLATRQPPALTSTAPWTTNGTAADLRLLVQADVEPDADGDGKGDVSQDGADLVVTGGGPSEIGPLDSFTHTYTIKNAGPDAALDVAVVLKRDAIAVPPPLPAGVTCVPSGADTVKCTLDRLASGAALSLMPGVTAAGVLTLAGRTTTTSATATALTPDADAINNTASLSTYVRPYVPSLPPQQPFVARPCANVIRGTRDDDALRGTVFGDRLVGNDGGDLLKGGGGDDCLEGGAGNDVLDSGDGNDRLAGSSGKDRLSAGNGDDRLTGGKGNDRLNGGNGNDLLSPGDGKDAIAGGRGNDTINSVDGVRETVDCGLGRDTVRADKRDRLVHCEKVTRRK